MAFHRFVTGDVFTRKRFDSNPLAIFPQAAGIGRGIRASVGGDCVPVLRGEAEL